MEETMTRRLTVGAAAAALIFVVTLFVKVPIPLGYANLGDGVIFLPRRSVRRWPISWGAFPCGSFRRLSSSTAWWRSSPGRRGTARAGARRRSSSDGCWPLCGTRRHTRWQGLPFTGAPGALSVKCGEYGRGLRGGFLRRGDALFRQIKKDPFFFEKRGPFCLVDKKFYYLINRILLKTANEKLKQKTKIEYTKNNSY